MSRRGHLRIAAAASHLRRVDRGESLAALGTTVRRASADLVDTFLVSGAPADRRFDTPLLVEVDRSLRDAYGVRKSVAVLIRPDGYMSYMGEPPARRGSGENDTDRQRFGRF